MVRERRGPDRREVDDTIPWRPRGGVAEWTNASVLKTDVGQPTVGSNPTPSAREPRLVCAALIVTDARSARSLADAPLPNDLGDAEEKDHARGDGQRPARSTHLG